MFKNIFVACSVLLFCSFAAASDSTPQKDTRPKSVYCAALSCWQQTPCAQHINRQVLDKDCIRLIAEYCKPSVEVDMRTSSPMDRALGGLSPDFRSKSFALVFPEKKDDFKIYAFTITPSYHRPHCLVHAMWSDDPKKKSHKKGYDVVRDRRGGLKTILNNGTDEISDLQYQAAKKGYLNDLVSKGCSYYSDELSSNIAMPGIQSTCTITPVQIKRKGKDFHRLHVLLEHDTAVLEDFINQAINGNAVSKTK